MTAGARAFRRVFTPLQQRDQSRRPADSCADRGAMECLLVLHALVKQMPLVESVQISVVIAGLVPNGLFLSICVAYALGCRAHRALRRAGSAGERHRVAQQRGCAVPGQDRHPDHQPIAGGRHPSASRRSRNLTHVLGVMVASARTSNRTSAAIATAYPSQPRTPSPRCPSPRRASGARWLSRTSDQRRTTKEYSNRAKALPSTTAALRRSSLVLCLASSP